MKKKEKENNNNNNNNKKRELKKIEGVWGEGRGFEKKRKSGSGENIRHSNLLRV